MKQNAGNKPGKYAKWEGGLAKVGIAVFATFLLFPIFGPFSLLISAIALCVALFVKSAPSPQQRLEQLEELKRSGSLTEEEYAAKRREILNDL